MALMTCIEVPVLGRSASSGYRVRSLEYGRVEIAHAGRECIGIGSQTELGTACLRTASRTSAQSLRIHERIVGRDGESVQGRYVLQQAVHALLMRRIRRIEAHRVAADTARGGKAVRCYGRRACGTASRSQEQDDKRRNTKADSMCCSSVHVMTPNAVVFGSVTGRTRNLFPDSSSGIKSTRYR
jgi:hypothetical protein